ncbi:hypothetical protein AKJ09_01594 [Labilithrix luteola]|uniref:Type IV fimbrial biogenesis protein PilY1 n=1 Tax=Labilithrix luteola TaxID=1391654 RepID=A0A0K1PN13_9BACT|nr:hypothetical protein [Labilithrix luteola]AKU94930.1 hypothetical protein AKJ09_01594 [Labilithrix luteola]
MNIRWMALVFVLGACASTQSDPGVTDDAHPIPPEPEPTPTTASDGGLDAAPEFDAGPCEDCEYFPAACSADAFCPNGPSGTDLGDASVDPLLTISTIRGRSGKDVWAVGTTGTILHFDGTAWSRSELGSLETLRGLWLRDGGEVVLAPSWNVYTRNLDLPDAGADGGATPSAGGWTLTPPALASELNSYRTYAPLAYVWSAPGSQWLWTLTSLVGQTNFKTTGLWRAHQLPSNKFAFEAGVSTATCTDNGCMRMRGIHGASADELWAVGESGAAILILGAEGNTPTVKGFDSRTLNALHAVWAASKSDAWAVGAKGTIRHYTGDPTHWDVVSDVPTDETLRAVWGFSATDIWAVGDAGVVIHYDGTSWSRVKVAGLGKRRANLTAVWGPEAGHVWVGGEGTILSLGGKP